VFEDEKFHECEEASCVQECVRREVFRLCKEIFPVPEYLSVYMGKRYVIVCEEISRVLDG
jgi:hypothetical protein